MSQNFYELVCVQCKTSWREEETCTRCKKCQSALDVIYDYEVIQTNLNKFVLRHAPLSAMKYLDFYPIRDRKKIISLQEGDTPLYHVKKMRRSRELRHLYIKDEGANPTGVFKDRGSLVEVTKALEMKAKAIVVASTGNMAASVSAYAGKAEIPCYVLIPEGTPIGKLAQSLAYGATILQVRGTYADCARLAEEMAEKYGFYLSGDYAFRSEGNKSIAFEIIEQLSWQVPDVVVMPVGCGTNMSAVWKGFQEFYELGFIYKLPRMIGVQAEGCSTIVAAFEQNKDRYVYVEKPKTICSAVGIGVPIDDIKALRTLRESKGAVATVPDDTVLEVQQEMAETASIFTEPAGVLPVAALKDLKERKVITKDDIVVCIVTGTGLKDPKSAVLMHHTPVSVEPDIHNVDEFLASGMAAIKSSGINLNQKGEVVFPSFPSDRKLKNTLSELFHFMPSGTLFRKFKEALRTFFEKRTKMRKPELKLFLDDFIAHFGSYEAVLEIENFHIETSLHQKARAEIELIFQKRKISAASAGGGPVDAALTALRKALAKETDFFVQLQDYSVNIPSGGVDVSVVVNIVMADQESNQVVGTAASPDVIVASLRAFVNGFNLLWNKRKKK